jgi:hypothetical protein
MNGSRALVLMLAGACAPKPSSPSGTPTTAPIVEAPREPSPTTPPAAPADVPVVAETTEPAAPKVLLTIGADWDATPGHETITLFDDGRLVAGTDEGRASLPSSAGHHFEQQALLDVVDLGDAKFERALIVAIPTGEDEDPPNVYQVFVSEAGALRKVYEGTIGNYGVVPLEFPGDGTMSWVEDGWTACQRAKFPATTKRQRVVLRIGKDGMLAEVKRRPTKQLQKCGELAACPFVYVLGEGAPVLQGEILRNLRGRAAYETQSLALSGISGDELRIRIAEEKDEVTHLDAIVLIADGNEVLPLSCGASPRPAFCTADHDYERLIRGDALDLTFALPHDAHALELRATGYYVAHAAH